MGIVSCINELEQDVYIYYVDMPCTIAANIVEGADGSYTLYLNSKLTSERQFEGYLHEISHVVNSDLKECDDVNYYELRAHNQ